MYEPKQPPSSDPVATWMMGELLAIARILSEGQDYIRHPQQFKAPSKPREGDLANADGTSWNPGGGAGLYQYLGGAWVKV